MIVHLFLSITILY